MIKFSKKNRLSYLKNKTVNILMKGGKKNTGEKILTKSLKLTHKSTTQKTISVFHSAVVNSSSAFKISEQAVKKGKRKSTKTIPSFIISDSKRITNTIKLLKGISSKNKNSNHLYQNLSLELLSSAASKSQTVDQKNNIQKQILMNKRYLTKFRW